jgi:uncharacterized membrane protein
VEPLPPSQPARLVVLGFDDELSAFALRNLLVELEDESILDIGDAVIATRNSKGKVRLHQSLPLTSGMASVGGVSGMFVGAMLLDPLFGAIAGIAAGAVLSKFRDIGIDDAFMKELGETLTPGSSMLFVLVRRSQPEQILERLNPFAGRCRILQSTMTIENEALLRDLLERGTPTPT